MIDELTAEEFIKIPTRLVFLVVVLDGFGTSGLSHGEEITEVCGSFVGNELGLGLRAVVVFAWSIETAVYTGVKIGTAIGTG